MKQTLSKKFCKKRSSVEEFNDYLKEHGIVTIVPSRKNTVEQGQIEYLNNEENTRSYYHRMIETNIGLLHFVTGGSGEMKIITDWFYKQCRVQHSLS